MPVLTGSDSGTDLHTGIYLCAWINIETTYSNENSIQTYNHARTMRIHVGILLIYMPFMFWYQTKLCLHTVKTFKVAALGLTLVGRKRR